MALHHFWKARGQISCFLLTILSSFLFDCMWDLFLEEARVTDFRTLWRRRWAEVVIYSWTHMNGWQIFKRYLWNLNSWSTFTLLMKRIILLVRIKLSIWGLLQCLIMVISSLWLLYQCLDVWADKVFIGLLLAAVFTSVVCWAEILRVSKPVNLHSIYTLKISDRRLFWGLLTIL